MKEANIYCNLFVLGITFLRSDSLDRFGCIEDWHISKYCMYVLCGIKCFLEKYRKCNESFELTTIQFACSIKTASVEKCRFF